MDSFEAHLQELRRRILYIGVVLVVATAGSFYYSSEVLNWLQKDLQVKVHALQAFEVFYTEIMIAIILGFFISLPFTFYQILQFMKPGLKDYEYRVLRNYLPFSVLLFILGAGFSYEYVIKNSFSFFKAVGQNAQVESVWGLKNTLGFAMKISGITGIFFQLPIVSVVLAETGMLTSDQMLEYRNYFAVGVLLVSAMVTPPDMITQVLITLPIIGLYQLSIWLVKRVE